MFKVTFSSSKPVKVTFGGNESFQPKMTELIPVIPSNYGLITWDGSVLTVS